MGAISQRICEIFHLMTHQHAAGQGVAAEASGPSGLSRLSGHSGGQNDSPGPRCPVMSTPFTDLHVCERRATGSQFRGDPLKTPLTLRGIAVARSRSRHRRSTLAPRYRTFFLRTLESLHTLPGLPGDLDTPVSRFARSEPAARAGRQLLEWWWRAWLQFGDRHAADSLG